MRVTLIESEGRGGAAAIEIEGQRLRVVDHFSAAERAEPAGPLADARLGVVVDARLTRRAALDAQPRDGFEPDHGWRYRAHGHIVSTRPVWADLGVLRLELSDVDVDDWEIGDRVVVAIDRIVLTRDRAPGR